MADSTVKMPIQPLMRQMTLNVQVTGLTVWRWRIWLGLQLIKAAAWVIGCNICVDRLNAELFVAGKHQP